MGIPLLKRLVGRFGHAPGRSQFSSPFSRRQAAGLVLAFCLLMTGRLIRHRMLIDPGGNWREDMWLDEFVLPPAQAQDARRKAKPELTDPLPINTCSVDSLTLLSGVGPVLAGRIDQERQKGTVFRCGEDLRLVKGIGPALSARLTPLVVFAEIADEDSLAEDSP